MYPDFVGIKYYEGYIIRMSVGITQSPHSVGFNLLLHWALKKDVRLKFEFWNKKESSRKIPMSAASTIQ